MVKSKTSRLDIAEMIIKYGMVLSGVVLMILHFVNPTDFDKWWSYVAEIALPFAPDIVAFFGIKPSQKLRIAYQLFLIPSMLLGICLNWYTEVYIFEQPMFDKVAHALSGVLAAFVGREALEKNYDGIQVGRKRKYHRGFTFLFIISFVAFTAAAWECFEFLFDQFCGGQMQELIAPGVADTMWDIVGAMGAGLITAYPLSKLKNK